MMVEIIARLCEAGYDDKILVSHDELCFSGFDVNPKINPAPRFNYCFEYILPKLLGDIAEKLTTDNVMKMLKCEG